MQYHDHENYPKLIRNSNAQIYLSILFIVLWSPGFIVTKIGLRYSEPFTLIWWRLLIAVIVSTFFAFWVKVPWPRKLKTIMHLAISGSLLHVFYVVASWMAVYRNTPVGLVAIIVGLQPLLTTILASPILGEKITYKQWLGLLLGFIGIIFIIEPKLQNMTVDLEGILLVSAALVSITLGTIYQKKFCQNVDMRAGRVIQLAFSFLLIWPMIYIFHEQSIHWSNEFIFCLFWLSVMQSVCAISVLGWLIRKGAVSTVALIFYLIPPLTTLYAYILFDEKLGWLGIIGMLITMFGIALALNFIKLKKNHLKINIDYKNHQLSSSTLKVFSEE
ncbi:MAG: DMT family transporter [Alphaproteobacteria bacterium]|nr:DMT family transporter [Alphaproteobacteria bacterium]